MANHFTTSPVKWTPDTLRTSSKPLWPKSKERAEPKCTESYAGVGGSNDAGRADCPHSMTESCRSSNVAFYVTTFPEQWLETIGVLGRTMHCSGSTRRLETQRRRCASPCCGKQLNRRCKRRSNPPGGLRPQRPHMFSPIPCR